MLANIKETLELYGIRFDVWFSEKILHTDGSIKRTLDILGKHGYLFEQDGATWFRSTAFGDDKDRVVRKSSGELTYVAADSAYLKNKIDRGYDRLIMILGHDHHSYVVRLQGLLKALQLDAQAQLDIILYQLVKIKVSGENVRMSKRAGTMVNLADVIETVGTDVARFFYLNRKADAQLDFDLDLALQHNETNPVYYVQYAYVRTKSVLSKAQEDAALHHITPADIATLNADERLLIKKIAALKTILATISTNYQTHLLTYYVLELAHTFHKYYSKNRVIDMDNVKQSRARLALITILRDTLETSLKLLGVSTPEKM
jgi:arginyl-tRNA synthetase